jgi:hypothetical protein
MSLLFSGRAVFSRTLVGPGISQWATHIGGASSENGAGIISDSAGNIYVTGYYSYFGSNPAIIYNQDGSQFGTLTNSGSADTYVVKYNSSGFAQWATRITGSDYDDGAGITIDSAGNIYVTGSYGSNPLTVYNAPGTSGTITLTTSASSDVFVVKYDSSGTALWATRIGGISSTFQTAVGMTSDSSGNIYVTGCYSSNPVTVYNSGGGTFGTLANSGSNDVYVVKYNSSGTAQWATRIGGSSGSEVATGIAVDSSGNIYVTGHYDSTSVTVYNAPGTSGTITLTNSGFANIYVVKYDSSSGTALWATRIGGSNGNSQGGGIISDSLGNIYVTGYYAANPLTIYNSGGGTFGTLTNSGSADTYVVKYNSSGVAQWGTRIGGTGGAGYDLAAGITSDSTGNIYVTARYGSNPVTVYNSGGGTFVTLASSGFTDVCVVKYSSSGIAQWATHIGGTSSDDGGAGITSDSTGNIYVTGSYSSNPLTIYNWGGGTRTLTNSGGNDAYIVKFMSGYT